MRNLGGYIRTVTYEHLTNVLHYIRQRQYMNSYLQLPKSSASHPSKYKLLFEKPLVGWIVLSAGLQRSASLKTRHLTVKSLSTCKGQWRGLVMYSRWVLLRACNTWGLGTSQWDPKEIQVVYLLSDDRTGLRYILYKSFCPISHAVGRVLRIHSVHNFALLLAGSPIGQQEGVFEYIMFISWLSNWLRRNAVQKICSNFPETVFTNFIIL